MGNWVLLCVLAYIGLVMVIYIILLKRRR